MDTDTYVGIDIAKDRLDIAVRPTGASWSAPNDDAGIDDLRARLAGLAPSLIVVEASGGYERPVVAALATAGLPSRSSIPARRATSPTPSANSPRRMRSTPACWPTSRRWRGHRSSPCATTRPASSPTW